MVASFYFILGIEIIFLFGVIAFVRDTEYNQANENFKNKRTGKIFSVFQIVSFPNEPCIGSNKNGTCYTADQCSSRGGINSGNCAQGFGVCCTFTIGCGTTSSENCTYIESNNPTAGECRHTICPCNDNICQLRLDFDTFVIAGPSTNTDSEVKILLGNTISNAGVENSLASRCLTDTFSVTNSAGTNPAPICGTNSGQHMYVDVDRSRGGDGCNELDFQLGANGVFTMIPNRQWSIKVSMIECDAPWKAPDGCTQYFFDSSDVVQTYNYDQGQHLAFQRQTICVRRARGQCRICWTTMNDDDFAVSGLKMSGFTMKTKCCGYDKKDGVNDVGYDCVLIPGAVDVKANALLSNSRICGRSSGLVYTSGNGAKTVCSLRTPFEISFISDGFEVTGTEAQTKTKGFRLFYDQDNNC